MQNKEISISCGRRSRQAAVTRNATSAVRLGSSPSGSPARTATEEESGGDSTRDSRYDDSSSDTFVRPRATTKALKEAIRVGTWNVRTMGPVGSIRMLEEQMSKLKVSVMAICETRWKDFGDFRTPQGTHIYHSGGGNGVSGVGFFEKGKHSQSVESYKCVNERIMTLRMNSHPFCITFVCLYAPTSASSDEVIEEFYRTLQKVVEEIPKNDVLMIMGDFNAKVGGTAIGKEVGGFGLGEINERGEMLLNFCAANGLVVTNTLFKHHKRRVYTWKSPGDRFRNQIDYILVSKRWRNGVLDSKAFPGADINSDHNPVIANIKIKLRKLKKPTGRKVYNLECLADPVKKIEFEAELKNRFKVLEETDNLEELNEGLCDGMIKATEKVVGVRKFKKKKDWLSEETMKLVELKSAANNLSDRTEFKRLKAIVQREARKDKDKHWEEKCNTINDLFKKNSNNTMNEIKKLTKHRTNKPDSVKDKNGKILHEKQDICNRWKEYVSELYSETSHPDVSLNSPMDHSELEPDILIDEVREAIKNLKNKKAPGEDGVVSEMLKASGETGVNLMHRICCLIWKERKWPASWKKSVMVTLHKKGDTAECGNYRTLSLISNASKVLLGIIIKRIERRYESELSDKQLGFRRGVGTREGIFNLQQIAEKYLENNKPIFALFIDYSKAFDSVRHTELWRVLSELGFPSHIIELMKSLYSESTAVVRLSSGTTDKIEMRKDVRQGCPISPPMFNLYTEKIMRDSADRCDIGLTVSGKRVNNLRYADDTVLLAETEQDLERLLHEVNRSGEEFGLKLNVGKTKAMVISKTTETCTIKINGRQIECVDRFVYLGGVVTRSGGTDENIKTRIGIAKSKFAEFDSIWKDDNITMRLKIRILESVIWPVALYSCETWTLRKEDERRIEAFEMWGLRKILRVSWFQHISNEEVLRRTRRVRRLLGLVKTRKLRFFGHVVRSEGLQRDLMDGYVDGKRGRGRPRKKWMDDVREWTGFGSGSGAALLEAARDRVAWRRKSILHMIIGNPQILRTLQ